MKAASGLAAAEVERLLEETKPEEPRETGQETGTIFFADLVGSTARKLEEGHRSGVMAAMQHNRFCSLVVDQYDGEVLKELGDGVLAMFPNPLQAVLAAETIRTRLMSTDLSTKVGMTIGLVDVVEVEGRRDALGAAVDRAARIQSAALPDQILIDETLLGTIRDFLRDHPHIHLGQDLILPLRGVGDVKLWPVESSAMEASEPRLPERLLVYGAGRLPTADKVRFMEYAKTEIVEFGTGLTTFAGYFDSLSPRLWREPVLRLLRDGVDIRCFLLDPEGNVAEAYYQFREESGYRRKTVETLEHLRELRDELNDESDAGKVHLATYDSMPLQYVMAVDLTSDRSAMQFSPYLPSLRRAECPVYEVSRSAEPDLFERLRTSLVSQMEDSKPVP